jgi:hypothetical protein
MHFDPATFLFGLLDNKLSSVANEGIAGEDVFILGSGPSIDEVDLSAVRGSFVVGLNSAFSLFRYCGSGNRYFWFCQDTKALMEFLPQIPSEVSKLVTVHRFNKYSQIRGFLGPNDRFLQPRISIFGRGQHDKPWRLRAWVPRPAMKSGPPYLHDPTAAHLTLFPSTVMLTAISLFGGFGARNIYCMGFDLTPNDKEQKKVSNLVHQSYKNKGFPSDSISFYLAGLSEEMKQNGQTLWNCSPLTFERVLLKSHRFNKFGVNYD